MSARNSGIDRREALELLASIPFASVFTSTGGEVARAQEAVRSGFTPQFFTEEEHRTVRLLADMILPRDERSGSATDAHVPEFLDFMMTDQPERQVAMRGGLAWLDLECRERFGRRFVECADGERGEILDLVAWPDRAPPELS
ncbi:MAG TPA: gluconate 2-dehydrogenase subunit 3 family protein, partial [Vicinamibacteria bacterium]